ncbi:MAG: phosphopantothenoylcysteine decarboxylase [Candidatus Omnitrophica bacterium]|nr:phosphopantothenoylcysteine decarboxylase [Candidatus Omnitrophota bacterium]MCM8768507.1 phosphopantothenoylcysteine decarboxylase [Candidatus Omnitrophota bacterium]
MNILVTAGPTREFLDPVRFLSNPATGYLGYEVARQAIWRGHRVTLISGPTFLSAPPKAKCVKVVSALEMRQAVRCHFPLNDALVMTAAVTDWRPARREKTKIKRKSGWKLTLVANPDILGEIKSKKRDDQVIIGFALETEQLGQRGLKKLQTKGMDLVIVDTPDYFGVYPEKGPVMAITADGEQNNLTGINKPALASFIVDYLEAKGVGRLRCLSSLLPKYQKREKND